ncbi:hypothetical protein MGG_17181 [Pyricularia oryzae 70-15]|uniref:Uncharacterized protein n=3 Tax=Pyricularia TaxID=48558 RepID=A0ABQ8NPV0_PYRGI|nr:uncharacterized protein MGG_17181 [Pyricularia oryzae 70-15]KAH8843469.1 hypothetical protein MCOR01_004272 [Pyricularia oryzae]KAI6299845.1 hypothetical protein MCOR33_004334 [Pyricularia grisea]EHA50797.1 hypothetical protein MGG_17181 [Pyricularia oryzae 70-15]KAI6269791.1 hypothetical protein MCOR26_008549 [Pyricularia oryzae]KAI6343687.1 hypothetical protein MCOR30_001361 [Pyricularia oryzae]
MAIALGTVSNRLTVSAGGLQDCKPPPGTRCRAGRAGQGRPQFGDPLYCTGRDTETEEDVLWLPGCWCMGDFGFGFGHQINPDQSPGHVHVPVRPQNGPPTGSCLPLAKPWPGTADHHRVQACMSVSTQLSVRTLLRDHHVGTRALVT